MAIDCGVDCEGGGISVAPGLKPNTIQVGLEKIRMNYGGKDGGAHSRDIESGVDDRTFILQAVKLDDCKPLTYSDEEREESFGRK